VCSNDAGRAKLRRGTLGRPLVSGIPSVATLLTYCASAVKGRRSVTAVGYMEGLGRIERADCNVISVRISERKLLSPSAGIHMWRFLEQPDERTRPWQNYVEVVDPEEQERRPLPGLA
jgi:hypothetical protein